MSEHEFDQQFPDDLLSVPTVSDYVRVQAALLDNAELRTQTVERLASWLGDSKVGKGWGERCALATDALNFVFDLHL